MAREVGGVRPSERQLTATEPRCNQPMLTKTALPHVTTP